MSDPRLHGILGRIVNRLLAKDGAVKWMPLDPELRARLIAERKQQIIDEDEILEEEDERTAPI